MQISPNVIEDILNRANIVDIVSEYVELEKKGKNFIGICPFHGDTNPSMSVSVEKKIYKCFSCGAGGSAVKFIQDYEKIPFLEALKKVADKTGVDLNINFNRTNEKHTKYNSINEKATKLYELYLLNTTQGKSALQYLYDRGLTVDTIKQFRIGLASSENNLLYRTLKEKNVENLDMIKLGLIRENNSDFYDLFRNRIIFPIADKYGSVVGFSGRTLNKDEPKYVNSIETPVFKKSELLYNYFNASNEIRKSNRVVLFEGFMDVIASYNAGIKEGVATMGTALTKGHISLLKKVTKNVTICFDGDNAGIEAANNAIKYLKDGFNLKVVVLPKSLDPDDFIKKYSKEEFIDYLNNKFMDILEFLFKYNLSKINKTNINEVEQFKRSIFDLIKNSSGTQKEIYLNRISRELDVSYESIRMDYLQVDNIKVKRVKESKNEVCVTMKDERAEKILLARMLENKDVALKLNKRIGDDYVIKDHEIIRASLMDYYKLSSEYDKDKFLDFLPNNLKEYFLENFDSPRKSTEKEIDDCLVTLSQYNYRQQEKALKELLKKENDEQRKEEIANIIGNLQKKYKRGGSNE